MGDLMLNVWAACGDNGLHMAAEAAAGGHNLSVGEGIPDLRDHGLEVVQIQVGGIDLPLDDAPPEEVERI